MSYLPPAWLIGAQALDHTGDLHLAPGAHFRVVTHPLAGLPLRPLLVYRANLGQSAKNAVLRQDITWTDGDGAIVPTPFTLIKGKPVYGWLPVGANTRCVWIKPVYEAAKTLRMDAFIHDGYGRTIVGTRTAAPFEIGASAIQGIVLTGEGTTIYGVRWLDLESIPIGKDIFQVLNLPVKDGPRYVSGLPDPAKSSLDRATAAAQLRLGLHDQPGAADPAATTPISQADESNRLKEITPGLTQPLKVLIQDTSASQQALRYDQPLPDGLPQPGNASVSCLGAVLSAAADPGVARWLGLLGHDKSPPGVAGDVIVYLIRGFWQIDGDTLDAAQKNGLAAATSAPITGNTLPDPNLPFAWPKAPADPGKGYVLYDFRVPAILTLGAPPLRPAAPLLGPETPGAGPWLPAPPPVALRELKLRVAGLVPGACLGFARQDGGGLHALNEFTPIHKRALPLVVAHPPDAGQGDLGDIFDREAPESAFTHRVAQADWFGRWSPWASIAVTAAARPLPPAPVLEPKYTVATYGAPPPAGPLWGTLTVRVPVPPVAELPPGSLLLKTLRLTGTIDGVPFSVDTLLPPAVDHLDVTLPGPPGRLMPCTQAVAVIEGTWRNTADLPGPSSAKRTVQLLDPRPPPAVVLDPALKYSARPDATGRARVTLEWPVAPGQQRFRVYACDETRLLAVLAGKPGTAGFFAAHAAATTAAARGQAFTDHASLFVRDYFENLTGEALTIPEGATTVRFQHVVSGSLRVLTLYRVVAVSALNVETPWAQTPLVPYGVPNSGPPPQPMLEVVAPASITVDDPPLAAGAVRLRVRVIRGSMPAARYRLRRSNTTSSDPLRMLAVAEGPIAWDPGLPDDPPTFHVDDPGTLPGVPGASLRPWTRYSWRVEVQAPSEPGSAVPGEWSTASAAASTSTVLPPPAAADNLSLQPAGPGHKLSWHHPDPLQGGSLGAYFFEVYRRLPADKVERKLGELAVDAPAAAGGRGPGNTFFLVDADVVDPGTRYRVVARDPFGRRGPPSPETST